MTDEIKPGEIVTKVYDGPPIREMCRITAAGKIMIDWLVVEEVAAKYTHPRGPISKMYEQSFEGKSDIEILQLHRQAESEQWVWSLAIHMIAVRDGTWEPLP